MKTKSFWRRQFIFTLRLFSITIVALTAMTVLEVPTNLSFIQAIGGGAAK